jgi:multicomponent Na+:H+ antiporter subunit E
LSLAASVYSAVWVVFSGYDDISSWIIGVPAVIAAIWSHLRLSSRGQKRPSVRGILRFLPFFLWESFRGGLDVTRRVIGRRLDVEPGLFEYPLRLETPFERTLFVGLVSLLPGTLSADLQGSRLRVHTLDRRVDVAAELESLERRMASCSVKSRRDLKG